MTKKRTKKKGFSTVKAVKTNARERVGQPKAERVIDEKPRSSERETKYKRTLSKLLSETE